MRVLLACLLLACRNGWAKLSASPRPSAPLAPTSASDDGRCFRVSVQGQSASSYQVIVLALVAPFELNASPVRLQHCVGYDLDHPEAGAESFGEPVLLNRSADGSFWSANISLEQAPRDGALLRTRITASSLSGVCNGSDDGFVIGFGRFLASSKVPPLFLYAADSAALDWDTPTRAFVVFDAGGGSGPTFYKASAHRGGSNRHDAPSQQTPMITGPYSKSKVLRLTGVLRTSDSRRRIGQNASSCSPFTTAQSSCGEMAQEPA